MMKYKYKGYSGFAEYDADAELFHGDVITARDVITFQGVTNEAAKAAFEESVDDYLSWCAEYGFAPEEPPDAGTAETLRANWQSKEAVLFGNGVTRARRG